MAERRGSVTVLFTAALMLIVVCMGAAIDYGLALTRRDRASSVLDMAVVAAAAAVQSSTTANDAVSRQTLASSVVKTFVASSEAASVISEPAVTVSSNGLDVTIKATAGGSSPTSVLALVGVKKVDYRVTSSSAAAIAPYIEVTLMVDTSASMALGATAADIQRLSSRFGCAFACHDDPGRDSFAWAGANGVKLRYDLIRDAILNFANYIESINGQGRIKVQLYTFDDGLRLNQGLTASMALIRSRLPSAPQTSSETAGGTRWWTYANSIPGLIGTGGDGSMASKPVKLVMLLTDGVQDPNRTWTWDLPLRDYVREFSWAPCNTLRDQNVKVGVIQTPYLEMAWDWGYVATLAQPSKLGRPGKDRLADTTHALQKCGGGYHYLATAPDAVSKSFETLYKRMLPPRLSS